MRWLGDGTLVAPGEKIGLAEFLTPGRGSYARGGNVYSMASGHVSITESSLDKGKAVIKVFNTKRPRSLDVLKVGVRVLGRVLRISTQQVSIEILAAEVTGPLKESRSGIIRKDDIAKGPSEQLVVAECLRTGDIVLARILSLGDARRYILSTAENSLGVVRASFQTGAGDTCIPSISLPESHGQGRSPFRKRKYAESIKDREILSLFRPKL